MTIFEGMKGYDKLKGVMYDHIGFSINGIQVYENVETFPETLIFETGQDHVIPLLRFPDKDRQEWSPPEMWDCDVIEIDNTLLSGESTLLFISHDGYEWHYRSVFTMDRDGEDYIACPSNDVRYLYVNFLSSKTVNHGSIFLDGVKAILPEETISKLKEEVK